MWWEQGVHKAHIGVHALEDLASSNDGSDDGTETSLCQHDVSGSAGSLSGTCTHVVTQLQR